MPRPYFNFVIYWTSHNNFGVFFLKFRPRTTPNAVVVCLLLPKFFCILLKKGNDNINMNRSRLRKIFGLKEKQERFRPPKRFYSSFHEMLKNSYSNGQDRSKFGNVQAWTQYQFGTNRGKHWRTHFKNEKSSISSNKTCINELRFTQTRVHFS